MTKAIIDYSVLDKMREEFYKNNTIDFDAIFDNPPAGSLADICNKYVEMEPILRAVLPILECRLHDAESRHDSYGEDFMSDGLYQVMQETQALIHRINKVLE